MAKALKAGIGLKYQLPLIVLYAAVVASLGVTRAAELKTLIRSSAMAGVVGVGFLILQEILPRTAKEIIVFWRVKDRLPGCRAISKYALHDPRIDQARLKKLLPKETLTSAAENAIWYRWLKEVEKDPGIADNHQRFLALRECAVLVLLLGLVSIAIPLTRTMPWGTASLLSLGCVVLYLAIAFAAQQAGKRLTLNVIALKVAKTAKK